MTLKTDKPKNIQAMIENRFRFLDLLMFRISPFRLRRFRRHERHRLRLRVKRSPPRPAFCCHPFSSPRSPCLCGEPLRSAIAYGFQRSEIASNWPLSPLPDTLMVSPAK